MLEKNHQSMKTVVETFLIEETVALIYDNEELDKWNKHVEELGLVGQTQIVQKEKSPIPFMHLKTSYQNICQQLCPTKIEVEKYSLTPIPVEILDLIALSKKEGYFTHIQIWYDDKSPDPFAIGLDRKYSNSISGGYIYRSAADAAASTDGKKTAQDLNYYYQDNHYLLGKWADVKHSWEELKEMATKRYIAEKGNEYQMKIKEAHRDIEDLSQKAFTQFN